MDTDPPAEIMHSDDRMRADSGTSRYAPGWCPGAHDEQCEFGPPTAHLDRHESTGAVSVIRCRRCGVGVSRPPLSDVAFLYGDRTSQDFQQSDSRVTRAIKSLAFRRQARVLLGQVRCRPGRVVDFGCGSGLFTRKLAELLPGSTVIGTDFHPTPPPELGDEHYEPLESTAGLAGHADLVLAMHVLEHDDDPTALLARIAGLAKPGGRVVLEVPNVECIWAGVFGRYWDSWYLPYHRVHFSSESLCSLIRQSGLTVELQIASCIPTMGRTIANLLGCRNSVVFLLLGIALHPLQWLGERLSGRPSALRLIARTPSL
jgi:2-polyprenyl-3-methyl-5-hydroxy-6-metoxy-1,4-benzoquinol methylase